MAPQARLLGMNHVALEVGDIDEALAFYRRLFGFELRGRHGSSMAFVDAGDQFIALSAPRHQPPDEDRHFGLVVDDRDAVRAALVEHAIEQLPSRGLEFRDPWGNRIQVVQYDEVQFTKTDAALRVAGAGPIAKTDAAQAEMRERGLLPE